MEALPDLTKLIAAHGVYALTVIFIFYQQRRAYQNLREASAGHERLYFRRVHVSVVAATYVLALLSTMAWFYATFMYEPVRLIKGEVSGLVRTVAESSGTEIETRHQQLAPDRAGDFDFYPVTDYPTSTGEYPFRWVVLARGQLRHIAFRFVQESALTTDVPLIGQTVPGADQVSHAASRTQKKSIVEKRFVLDLNALHYSPTRAIHLTYKSADDPASVGHFWLSREDGGFDPIQWAEATDLVQPRLTTRLLEVLAPALLAMSGPTIFNKDGTYTAEAGRALQLQLGSDELRTRLNARELLTQSGRASFKFIIDVLDKKIAAPSPSSDWALLIDSLSKAVDDIELRGERFPPEGHLKLAVASYDISDYRSAAFHFDKAGDALTRREPLHMAMRGHSYVETGRFAEAINTLNQYLAADISPQSRVWARNALGWLYHHTGRWADAIREEKEALRIAPDSPEAMNSLAYTYAKQGTNLSGALTLIDRAQMLKPNDPNIWETRGYILFRLGRTEQGLELIRRALVKLPDDLDTQRDLKEAEAAVASHRLTSAATRASK